MISVIGIGPSREDMTFRAVNAIKSAAIRKMLLLTS